MPSQILDEDANLIYAGLTYKGAYEAIKAAKGATGDKIERLPASVHRVVDLLEKQGFKVRGLS